MIGFKQTFKFITVLVLAVAAGVSAAEEVTVLSFGDASQQAQLRFSPVAGESRSVSFHKERSTTMEVDSGEVADKAYQKKQTLGPPTIDGVRLIRHLSTKSEGHVYEDILTDFELTSTGLPTGYASPGATPDTGIGEELECLNSQKGQPLEFQFSSKGSRVWLPVKSPETFCNMTGAVIDEMDELFRVVFPEEAVGIGARWKVRRQAFPKENPVNIVCETTFTLEKIEGSLATISAVLSGESKNLETPNAFPGAAKSVLDVINVTGKGRTIVDLTFPEPIESSIEAHMAYTLSVEAGSGKTKIQFEGTTKRTSQLAEAADQQPAGASPDPNSAEAADPK